MRRLLPVLCLLVGGCAIFQGAPPAGPTAAIGLVSGQLHAPTSFEAVPISRGPVSFAGSLQE